MMSRIIWTVLIACAVVFSSPRIRAQGALVPPGPPAPTMKTLDQLEPRIPIASLPCTISQPGSYYLTANLVGVAGKDGITISASNVSLDLGGFQLQGSINSLCGIAVYGSQTNISIVNGTIAAWGQQGIAAAGAANSRFADLRILGNGRDARAEGLRAGRNSLVKDCLSQSNSAQGISVLDGSTVLGCTSCRNGSPGIAAGLGCVIMSCTAQENLAAGIRIEGEGTITNSVARANQAEGIWAGKGGVTVADCTASSNTGAGILLGDDATAKQCLAARNGSAGINAGDFCTITNCTANLNVVSGIFAGNGVIISGCSASRNSGCGIRVGESCHVISNTCTYNANAHSNASGIYASGDYNRLEANHVLRNDRGIDVIGSGNLVVKNTALSNPPVGDLMNYVVASQNKTGAVAATPSAAGPWDNF